MQSLRTRKSSEPNARKLTKPRAEGHNRKASRVDDKIRKRMSMRYADISSPTDLSIPAVPAIPAGLTAALPKGKQLFVDEPEEIGQDTRVSDLKLLDQDNFDPDACEFLPRHKNGVTNSRRSSENETREFHRGGTEVPPILITGAEGWGSSRFATECVQEVRYTNGQ